MKNDHDNNEVAITLAIIIIAKSLLVAWLESFFSSSACRLKSNSGLG